MLDGDSIVSALTKRFEPHHLDKPELLTGRFDCLAQIGRLEYGDIDSAERVEYVRCAMFHMATLPSNTSNDGRSGQISFVRAY